MNWRWHVALHLEGIRRLSVWLCEHIIYSIKYKTIVLYTLVQYEQFRGTHVLKKNT